MSDFRETVATYDIHRRRRVTYHAVFTLEQPLSHIGETQGNVSNLNTIGVNDLQGFPRKTFIFSGNAIRNGIFRRKGVKAALQKLGVQVNPDTHHMMLAGGKINSSLVSDMGLEERIRKLCPWISVLGTAKPDGAFGAKGSMMIEGRFGVGNGYLICYEAARYIPAWLLPLDIARAIADIKRSEDELESKRFGDGITDLSVYGSEQERGHVDVLIKRHIDLVGKHLPMLQRELKSWQQLTTKRTFYRRDSLQDLSLRELLLKAPTKPQLQTSLLSDQPQEPKPKEKKSDLEDNRHMQVDRLIAQGNRLWSRWDFNGTDIEEGFLYSVLFEFAKEPIIGGKNAAGCGLVDLTLHYRDHETGQSGKLLTLSQNVLQSSDRVEKKKQRWEEYMGKYVGFIETNQAEMKGFLGA